MTAREACLAMQRGFHRIFPDAKYDLCPMADGGEGTVDTIIDGQQGQKVYITVSGPSHLYKVQT